MQLYLKYNVGTRILNTFIIFNIICEICSIYIICIYCINYKQYRYVYYDMV